MAAELRRFRLQLVERCSEALIKGLIDDLLHQKILNDAEKESIIQGNTLRADKCRLLIDTVIRKGDYSSNILLQEIKEKDPALSEDLGITAQLPLPTQEENSSYKPATLSGLGTIMDLKGVFPNTIVAGAGSIMDLNGSSPGTIVAGPRTVMDLNGSSPGTVVAGPESIMVLKGMSGTIVAGPGTIMDLNGVPPDSIVVHSGSIKDLKQRSPGIFVAVAGIIMELKEVSPGTNVAGPRTDLKGASPGTIDINGITLCSEAEYQEITTKETERYPIYDIANRKRWALIICNINFEDEAIKERKGADIDLKEMTKLLEGLGYNVRSESNLTAEEMRSTMKSFAAHTDHSQSDSTFLVFMSHGEKNIIYGTDVKKDVTRGLHVDEIFNMFNNKNCPGLRDKPKMILIQACRGNERSRVLVSDGAQQPANIKHEDLEADAVWLMHKESDFICFYSTTPDTVSYRDPAKGSLFIQSLIDFMKKDAHNSSIEDIFRKVRYSFRNDIQMPTLDRTTSLKKFFLFPGY
ncbi:caspase-1-B-like isoform X2 [Eleutherodactylus coqui]|uniref:caspase-1-B-like isoform X2 n=1 Tax=Eleutherodactylus coqui TaxID=57060 RepID=UPI0034624600